MQQPAGKLSRLTHEGAPVLETRARPRQDPVTPTALGELYTGHARRARDLAYLLTADRALAEDVIQDCFVAFDGEQDRRTAV